jgi:uncharacterized protein YndB with AHSA1/START domain
MKSQTSPGADREARALVVRRVFDAPPAIVFSLWSDPAYVRQWWHPRNFTTPAFEMDFRIGGAYRYCIRSHGKDHWAHGIYRDIEAPKRLVFTFQWESGNAVHDAETLITIAFAPEQSDRTLVTFRQEPFASISDRDSHAEGWGQVLDSFDAFVIMQRETR